MGNHVDKTFLQLHCLQGQLTIDLMFASVGRAQILLNCLLVVRPHWITGISGSCRCKRCVRLLRWVPFVDCTSLRRGEYLMRDCGSPSCTLVHTTAAMRLL